MNQTETIENYCQILRLTYLRDHYLGEIDNAVKAKLSFQDFLLAILRARLSIVSIIPSIGQ